MLGVIKGILASHGQAFRQALTTVFSRPMSAAVTIVVIAMTLTLPAIFWVFNDNFQHVGDTWRQSSRISLYLKLGTSDAEQTQVLQRIKMMPGVRDAVLRTPAEGLIELQSQEGMQDVMQYLPENPLPAVIEIFPTIEQATATALERLSAMLRPLPEVDQVRLDLEWVNRLHHVLTFITTLVHGFIVFLAFAVGLMISHTLRLAIHHRRDEIQVLKLIGAPSRFIMRPFLYMGVIYALFGCTIALFLTTGLVIRLSSLAEQLALTYGMHYGLFGLSLRQTMWLLVFSAGLGWLSARLSVKKQLDCIDAIA